MLFCIFHWLTELLNCDKLPFVCFGGHFPLFICGMQIKEAIEKYINKCRADNITLPAIKDKQKLLGLFCDWCDKPLNKIKIDDVYDFINQLKFTEMRLWRMKIDLKCFFRYCSENQIHHIPYTLINTKRPHDNIRPDLTEEEFKLLDEECHKLMERGREYYRWHTLIHFMWETGLRRHEILSLKRSDIDYTNKTFTVMSAKTKRIRRGYFTTDLLSYVYKFCNQGKSDKLFDVSPRQVMYCIEILRKKSGIQKHITAHCFRHGFCTRLLKNGMDIQTTSKLLGHCKLDTTMRYWHNSDIELRNSYEQYINAPKSFEFTSKVGRKQKFKIEFRITKNN